MNIKHYAIIISFLSFIVACKKDNSPVSTPKPPNAGEVENMTTLIVKLTNVANSNDTVKAMFRDVDGSGGLSWQLDSLVVSANTVYNAKIILLDESNAQHIIDVTQEIAQEKDFHQFFFYAESGIAITTQYLDQDNLGKPFGMLFKMTTGAVSSGIFRVKLTHFTDKADKDGTSPNGATDIYVEFPSRIKP